MTEALAEKIIAMRRRLREWKRSLVRFEAGNANIFYNNVNSNAEHIEMLRHLIDQEERMISHYDPDDCAVDGEIELSNVDVKLIEKLIPGRFVTFSLDPDGFATNLVIFNSEVEALQGAANCVGREYGKIGKENWSIVTADSHSLEI